MDQFLRDPTDDCVHSSLVCIRSVHCNSRSLCHRPQAEQIPRNQKRIELASGSGHRSNCARDFDDRPPCGNCGCTCSSSWSFVPLRTDDLFHAQAEVDGYSALKAKRDREWILGHVLLTPPFAPLFDEMMAFSTRL